MFQLQLQMRRLCNHGTFQKSSHDSKEFDPEQAIAELKRDNTSRCESCKFMVYSICGLRLEEKQTGTFTTCGHLLCERCIPKMTSALLPVEGQEDTFICSICSEIIRGDYLVVDEATAGQRNGTKRLSAWDYFDKNGCSTKMSAVVADLEEQQHKDEKR